MGPVADQTKWPQLRFARTGVYRRDDLSRSDGRSDQAAKVLNVNTRWQATQRTVMVTSRP